MMVHIIVMVALVHLFNIDPSFAGDHLSVKHPHVSRSGTQIVTPEKFQRALLDSLNHQFSIPGVALSVEVLVPKNPVKIPKGVVDIHVPSDTMNGRMGRRAYRMGVSVDQEFHRMVNVVAEIEAHMPVVMPVRFIKPHETIHAEDVLMRDYSLPTLMQDFLKSENTAIGKKATRLLPPNMPIQETFIAEPPVIHKGDRVIIKAHSGGLLVQTVGIAKGTGEPGKMIAVENQRSKREVMGRVLEAGVVEVTF